MVLVIRAEQMQVFKEAALRAFEDDMVGHCAAFSPLLFSAIGDQQIRMAIRSGIARANSYGFTCYGPVRLYLELMLLFGSHFDTDPQYPWAAEFLSNQEAGSSIQRAEELYKKTMEYQQAIAGPKDAYTFAALKAVAMFARQPLLQMTEENYIPSMVQEIASIYPQKAAYVGAESLDALIRKGMGGAKRQGFSSVRGSALISLLMFACGHGCGADPLFPWIARSLKDETIVDPEARLEEKAITSLERVIAFFEKGMILMRNPTPPSTGNKAGEPCDSIVQKSSLP